MPGYAEESELGTGGSGRVVAAVELASGERVAVKYLADQLVSDEQFRAAFRGEAEILARLNLPHAARVRGYVESPQGAAIIMDLVGGVTLRQVLARFGPAGPRAALSVLRGSLLALAGAHRAGIVHRDYKPENVMVDQAGASMLVDFGIALRAGTSGEPAGTPGYAPPEQWAGAPASPAGDIYAAAVTFTECVTGAQPPRGLLPPAPEPRAAADALGPRLAGLIARATAADPVARPADAAALLTELQDAADERYGAGWEQAGRADLARAAAALLALAAGAAAGAAASGQPPGSAQPAQGPAATASTTIRRARRIGRATRTGAGHGPAAALSAAAAVVVAGAAIAIATHHHGRRVPDATRANTTPVLGLVSSDPFQPGFGIAQPKSISLGDGPFGVGPHLHWESWGGPKAVATTANAGIFMGNPADSRIPPNNLGQATVVAFDLGTCRGRLVYQALEWYFPQHGQAFNPSTYFNTCTHLLVRH